MGAWGYGPFDNDTAADFANDLDEAPESARLDMLRTALVAVVGCAGHVDGNRAEVALAAATLVASDLNGGEEFQSQHYGPTSDLPSIPEDLIPVAADVIDCILNSDNDLKEYWSESSEAGKWFSVMRRLQKVLAGETSSSMDPLW